MKPYWEAITCAATQEFPNILREPKGALSCSQVSYHETYEPSPYYPILSL
jgi:hypothetical protein